MFGENDVIAPNGDRVYVEVAEALPEAVDLVISGHSHAAYNCEVAGKRVTAAAAYGKMLTDIDLEIDLEIDRESGEVLSVVATNRPVERDDVHPDMAALVEDAVAIVAPVAGAEVGSVTEDLLRTLGPGGQSPLGGVIADAQLASVSAPEDGAGNKVDPASMMLDGVPVGLDDEVRVAINDFVATGGQGFTGFANGTEVLGGPVDVEALAAYFGASSPVAPVTEERVTALP